jgi:hypothetical protein
MIIAVAAATMVISGCARPSAPALSPLGTTSASSTPTPSITPAGTLQGAATSEVNVPRQLRGDLTAVRVGKQDGYDRVVFEFGKDVPGYVVSYLRLPVKADGSGNIVAMPGAAEGVQVSFHPASGSDWGGNPPKPTYLGPNRVSAGAAQATEVVATGDFSGYLTWVVGLRHKVPFLVTRLDGPPRLVVDFQHATS